jgi:hypothetical protein
MAVAVVDTGDGSFHDAVAPAAGPDEYLHAEAKAPLGERYFLQYAAAVGSETAL